jgi:hypothetical protein
MVTSIRLQHIEDYVFMEVTYWWIFTKIYGVRKEVMSGWIIPKTLEEISLLFLTKCVNIKSGEKLSPNGYSSYNDKVDKIYNFVIETKSIMAKRLVAESFQKVYNSKTGVKNVKYTVI